MEPSTKEALKAMLLDQWIEDLRAERAPRMAPELADLSAEDIADILRTARWFKASLYPANESDASDAAVLARVLTTVQHEHEALMREADEMVGRAANFGALLQEVGRRRMIAVREFERTHALPEGTWRRLERGDLPPHRLPVEKMLAMLRGLQLTSQQVIDLIRWTGRNWIHRAYEQEQTQLGRVGGRASAEERRQILAEARAAEAGRQDQVEHELRQLERYCQELSGRLP